MSDLKVLIDKMVDRLVAAEERIAILERELAQIKERHEHEDTLSQEASDR